jgi:hypothetical protein
MKINRVNLRAEYLECDVEVLSLAKSLLTKEDLEKADDLALRLTTKNKGKAISELGKIIGITPKSEYFARPLYYLHHELLFLPRWTRDSIRYLGDYIDQLVKATAVEKIDATCEKYPLGTNIYKLKGKIDTQLWDALEKYNRILYVVGKHDFNRGNRRHRFTSKEVVYCGFVTRKLADWLMPLSQRKKYYSNGIFNY